jgi:diphthamide synthase (EF-2-diphthine--ammonia ligase)
VKEVVKQAEALGLPLVGVPLHANTATPYKDRVRDGISLVAKSCKVRQLCFGDLHLDHIRQWREDNLTEIAHAVGATLAYPIWKVRRPPAPLAATTCLAKCSKVTDACKSRMHSPTTDYK